jgi:hypothetical protein
MQAQTSNTFYQLSAVLDMAGVKPGRFHRHFYGGALGNILAEAGDLSNHISEPMRGPGVGRGGSRFVTLEGAICLGVFFRLISGGVHSAQAIRIALAFTFLGESGTGIRALRPGVPRQPGAEFAGAQDTFLVAVSDIPTPETGEGQGFAFVPGSGLPGIALAEWLGLHEMDTKPICLLNLSELCRGIRFGLESCPTLVVPGDTPAYRAPDWSETAAGPLGAFLAECACCDDRARIPTQEFLSRFDAWQMARTGASIIGEGGLKDAAIAVQDGLSALGIRKVKSNGIMTFTGIRWHDSHAARSALSAPAALE